MIRSIRATASTGYSPAAVSADSMRASAPSYTAVATSDASARVGAGLRIMDSSIWVATTTGLPARRADHPLLQAGHLLGRHLHPEIAARDHDAVGEIDDLVQVVERGRLLDFDHDRGPARDQTARLGHVLRPLHEAERNPVDAEVERKLQIVPVLVGQRRDRQNA